MVSPAVCTSHCSGVKNLTKVLLPGDDVVKQVPLTDRYKDYLAYSQLEPQQKHKI